MKRSKQLGSLFISVILLAAILNGVAAQNNLTDGKIVYTSGNLFFELFILSDHGNIQVTNISESIGNPMSPRWSPNGELIAFTNRQDVYLIEADGSNLQRLTFDPAISDQYLDWSPNGETLAVASSNSDTWQIRLIDVGTFETVDLTTGEYSDGLFGLSWSPNGKSIVFTSNRDSTIDDASGLYLLDVESGEVSSITSILYRRRDDRYPRWSPNGEQIAFVSENDDGSGWDVYISNSDGSQIFRLTDDTNAPEVSGSVFGGSLSWSPDGENIVFTACPALYPESCELYIIGLDGRGFAQVTADDTNGAFDPDWISTFRWNHIPTTEDELQP